VHDGRFRESRSCNPSLYGAANPRRPACLIVILTLGGFGILEDRMRHGFQIAISLMAVILLLRPFDCFAGAAPRRQAMDCCLKGKCVPTAKSDECCKNTVPDRNQLAPSKAADHSSPLIALVAVHIPAPVSSFTFGGVGDPVRHPPPRVGLAAPSLPLLI
jgi:hypothetical protein